MAEGGAFHQQQIRFDYLKNKIKFKRGPSCTLSLKLRRVDAAGSRGRQEEAGLCSQHHSWPSKSQFYQVLEMKLLKT